MDRYTPRNGSGLIAWQHIQFQQDATQKALANAFGDYIAIADSFYVSGGEVTATPNGTGMDYAITDGVVCIRGEFMPVAQGAVLKSA